MGVVFQPNIQTLSTGNGCSKKNLMFNNSNIVRITGIVTGLMAIIVIFMELVTGFMRHVAPYI